MRNCPECGSQLSGDILYCPFCGTRIDLLNSIKKERLLFFFTPVFLFFLGLAIAYDIGSKPMIEVGITLSGIGAYFYFIGALALVTFRFLFKIPCDSGSYFNSAFSSIINAVIALFATFAIEELFLSAMLYKFGPTEILKNRAVLFAVLYIPVQFVEILAVSARAKIIKEPESSKNVIGKLIFSKSYVIIPAVFMLLTSAGIYAASPSGRYGILCEFLMSLGANEKSLAYLDAAIEKEPENAKLYSLKSNLLAEIRSFDDQKKLKEALDLAEKAVALQPSSALYKYYLSQQLEINGDFESAIRVASEAALIAEKDAFLWLNLADLSQKYNKGTEAIAAYKKALTISPNNATALNNISYTLLDLDKDLPIALELAKKSVELMPNLIFNRDTLAWAYYKNKDYNRALEEMSLIYKDKQEISPEVDFHYAVILDSVGLLKNPLETYDKMLVKPEVLLNKSLKSQIMDIRNKREKRVKQ